MHKKKSDLRARLLNRQVLLGVVIAFLALALGLYFTLAVPSRSVLPPRADSTVLATTEVSRGVNRQPVDAQPAHSDSTSSQRRATSVKVDPTASWSIDTLSVPKTPLPAPVYAADDTSAYSTSPAAQALRAHRRMIEQGGNYLANNTLSATFVGAYGFRIETWLYYCHKTGTNPSDFSPAHQDQLANALVVDGYGGNWANVPQSGGW